MMMICDGKGDVFLPNLSGNIGAVTAASSKRCRSRPCLEENPAEVTASAGLLRVVETAELGGYPRRDRILAPDPAQVNRRRGRVLSELGHSDPQIRTAGLALTYAD